MYEHIPEHYRFVSHDKAVAALGRPQCTTLGDLVIQDWGGEFIRGSGAVAYSLNYVVISEFLSINLRCLVYSEQ